MCMISVFQIKFHKMPPKINFIERNKQNLARKKSALRREPEEPEKVKSNDSGKENKPSRQPVRASSAATSGSIPNSKPSNSRPVSAPGKPRSNTFIFN